MMMVIVMKMILVMTMMTTMGKCHVATRVGPTNDGFLPTGPLL